MLGLAARADPRDQAARGVGARDEIARVMDRARSQVKACYERELGGAPPDIATSESADGMSVELYFDMIGRKTAALIAATRRGCVHPMVPALV